MKIITEPEVYLIGKQVIVAEELKRFLRDHQIEEWKSDSEIPSQVLIEIAGRLCYQSYGNPRPGGNKAYIHHILESGHGSVAEMAVWNFIITNVSRSFTHEIIRHRHFSFAQLSQRYCNESVAEYIEPAIIKEDRHLHEIWIDTVQASHNAYKFIATELSKITDDMTQEQKTAARKEARQAARSVLSNATETKIFITANARALRNFIELRASRYADPEMRSVALKILAILKAEAPNIFGDYEVVKVEDNVFEAQTKYRKV